MTEPASDAPPVTLRFDRAMAFALSLHAVWAMCAKRSFPG